jgi:galactokinase
VGGPLAGRAAEGFERAFGRAPNGVWSAPGRVNLIGEHTDYNDGFVLPFAISQRTAVAAGISGGTGVIRARSTFSPEPAGAPLATIAPGAVEGWGAYVLGVAWALLAARTSAPFLPDVPGVDLFVDSEVPVGAGLSSSAAIECAVACALDELWDLGLDRASLALAGRRAENEVVGAPTGVMDQLASMLGQSGAAVFIDCRSLATELIPFDLEGAGHALLVIDTREHHAHATGGYAARRASCEEAARLAGVRALRDLKVADLDHLASVADEETFRRARHVVTEDARVLEMVAVLRASGPGAIGPLLSASHASMRDDFEITTPALDLAVSSSVAAGALGARMTGGGFGGAAIALAPASGAAAVQAAVEAAFAGAGFAPPAISTVAPSAGAGRDL